MSAMIIKIIAATIGSTAFGALFYVDRKNLKYVAMSGMICSFVYFVLLEIGTDTYIATLFASIAFGLYSEIMARIRKATVTTFIICGMIPLVPGSGMYYMMVEMVNNNQSAALGIALNTIGMAGMLAIGIIISATIAKLLKESFNY